MRPVEITSGHLLLRAPAPEDVPQLTAACQDPETQRWVPLPVPYTSADAHLFLQHASAGWAASSLASFVIVDVPTTRYLGTVDLRLDGHGMGEVGYHVAPWTRRQGVGTAALRMLCGWAFEGLGLARIEWQAQVGNEASRRLAERVGFTMEGLCRRRLAMRNGQRADAWIGGLLPGELR